jgi:DNA polymerase (family 10)
MDNRGVAKILREIADLLEVKGENTFRVRSYRMGADAVESHGEDLGEIVRSGRDLRTIESVGDGIAAKIREILETGDCEYHRALLVEVPGGLLELLQIPGLGPKGVQLVWRKLAVQGAADLEAAILDGRFRTLPGMKEKKEARILKGLQFRLDRTLRRFTLDVVAEEAARLTTYLSERGARHVEPVGSYRRCRETVGDLDVIVVADDPKALADAFVAHPEVKEVLGHGEAKSSAVLKSGLQVDLRPFETDSLGAALMYFTGSKAHNIALRERALRRGLKLNEYGLFRVEGGEKVAGRTEEEVYRALGLAWVPPELREDRGEVAAAEAEGLPNLVTLADLRGDLHSHTTESDGRDSLEDMVSAARKRGLRYLAVTEHSRAIPSRLRGTGMDEARCLQHIARVRALQERTLDFRILAGVEVDILPDGRLDMDGEVLAQLDVVVASLHSAFDLEREAMTDRLLRAFENPSFQIWGHPLGRLLGKREPVSLDLDRVLAEAVRRGVTLEVNSQPDRLDLPDPWIRTAREKGARFVVSSDSHSVASLANLRYGLSQARRGWLTAADVLNTREAPLLLASLRAGDEKRRET